MTEGRFLLQNAVAVSDESCHIGSGGYLKRSELVAIIADKYYNKLDGTKKKAVIKGLTFSVGVAVGEKYIYYYNGTASGKFQRYRCDVSGKNVKKIGGELKEAPYEWLAKYDEDQ